MPILFRTPLYIRYTHLSHETLILWQQPFHGCIPFYAYEDGLFCPITWNLRGLE